MALNFSGTNGEVNDDSGARLVTTGNRDDLEQPGERTRLVWGCRNTGIT